MHFFINFFFNNVINNKFNNYQFLFYKKSINDLQIISLSTLCLISFLFTQILMLKMIENANNENTLRYSKVLTFLKLGFG